MKSKRKTMLGVALAVAVIALAGIGYAVGHTAQTTSTDNDILPEYNVVKLTEDGTTIGAAYGGRHIHIEYNTETAYANSVETTTWTMKDASMEFEWHIHITSENIAVDNYKLRVSGLTVTGLTGATAAWTLNDTPVASQGDAFIEITGTSLTEVVLKLTITRGASVTQAPEDAAIGDLTFLLTNIAAAP